MDDFSLSSDSGPEVASHAQPGTGASTLQRPDRPCDICRKRKSRCVKEPAQEKCVLCSFHHRECTYLDEPQKRKRKRSNDGDSSVWSAAGHRSIGIGDDQVAQIRHSIITSPTSLSTPIPAVQGKSLLDKTLGLHRITHSTHIGPSSIHEPLLFTLLPSGTHDGAPSSKYRHVDSSTTFLRRHDRATLFHSDDDDDLSTIETTVRPHGPALVSLYFRTIHPSYPILHKGVFLEKYARSYREFSPPLLAAVYLLALDWWAYDRDLGSLPDSMRPNSAALVRTATKTLNSVIHRPKLSTVQAGLLLLQRSGGDSWPLTSQLVAVAEELGLHLDCAGWGIPDWEKGLRKRLSWAVYMQDKWGAMVHARPSHIADPTWQLPSLTVGDFPESAADESDKEGSTEVETGRQLFIQLSRLSTILATALEALYRLNGARVKEIIATQGVPGLLDLVKPIAVELKAWVAGLTPELGMEVVKTRKLCSNGYMHLSYYATEIIVHRAVIRALPSDTPPQLRSLCREAAASRLDHAMAFVESLRPEHLEGFWWFASSHCLALIGSFAALLWVTAVDEEEADNMRRKLEDFRWSLKVRAKGSPLSMAAIQELDHVLDGVDFDAVPRTVRDESEGLGESRTPRQFVLTAKGSFDFGTVETADEISHHQYVGDLGFHNDGSGMAFGPTSLFGGIGDSFNM